MKKIHGKYLWLLPVVPTVGLAGLAITGCGGGGAADSPPAVGRTFYSKMNSVLVGSSNLVDVGRGFVTLEANQNVPVAVGIELTSKAVTDLPKPPNFNDPVVYGVNLPPESVYTPFTYAAISYWSAHSPQGTGDVPHFHPLFGIGPPQQPSNACASVPIPFNCKDEAVKASAAETPKDYTFGGDLPGAGIVIAPGIGIAYEDEVLPQPQLLAGWNTIGQNYFFYQGHANGIGLGATNDYLLKQEKGNAPAVPDSVNQIKQPVSYPRPGYYPHRWDLRWDNARKVHLFILSDFQQATNVVVGLKKK